MVYEKVGVRPAPDDELSLIERRLEGISTEYTKGDYEKLAELTTEIFRMPESAVQESPGWIAYDNYPGIYTGRYIKVIMLFGKPTVTFLSLADGLVQTVLYQDVDCKAAAVWERAMDGVDIFGDPQNITISAKDSRFNNLTDPFDTTIDFVEEVVFLNDYPADFRYIFRWYDVEDYKNALGYEYYVRDESSSIISDLGEYYTGLFYSFTISPLEIF